jgi:hypothetical protein
VPGTLECCESGCKPDSVVDGHLSVRSTRDVTGGPPCPCSTLLHVGFTEPPRSPGTLVVSYTTLSPLPVPGEAIGGLLSAALSVGSPRLAVSQHAALWSPDFPQLLPTGRSRDRLPDSHPWKRREAAVRSRFRSAAAICEGPPGGTEDGGNDAEDGDLERRWPA